MGFQFSLEAVLKVRGIQEEREERLLQQILFEISQAQEALARNEAELAKSNASRHEEISNTVLGRNIHILYGEIRQLKENEKTLLARIEKLHELRDKQLKVYQAARRNREMLSDMRDNHLNAYEAETSRAEQKVLDDNYIARRGR